MSETVALGKNTPVFSKFEILACRDGLNHWVAKCSEFTCRCPVTGQPDYASLLIELDYLGGLSFFPETKTLKLYLETFRDTAMFHEKVAEKVAADLLVAIAQSAGRSLCRMNIKVTGLFNTRGGISVEATATRSVVVG